MIFKTKIWRAEALALLHTAVAPASRPVGRRSGLKASFESNAHATTVGLQPGDQPAALLRGLWTRVAWAGCVRLVPRSGLLKPLAMVRV
jgi:hypothetical protein